MKYFVGSDDEDARKSGVSRRELSQVRLREVIQNCDLFQSTTNKMQRYTVYLFL
jgi:hypothetical protein